MARSKEEFAALLTQALEQVKTLTGQHIYKIEDELAEAIHTGRDIIEKWRRLKHKLMPSPEQAEAVAKLLVDKGGLPGRGEFEKFLDYAGHLYAAQAWARLFPKIDGPEPVEHFIGRDKELKTLLQLLQPGQMVTLYGPGGVGKTALVAKTLQELSPRDIPPERFSEGIFFHDFYSQPSADAALEQIARFFGEELSPTPYAAARRALFNRKALLVLDGAEEADNLRKVVEVRGRSGVLIVTRHQHVIRGEPIYLEVLPLNQAIRVLQAWSTNDRNGAGFQVWSMAQEPDQKTATKICELIGRLPLALRLAGRYMLQCTTRALEFLELLERSDLSLWEEEKRQHQSVAVLLAKSVEKVSEDARTVLAVVGLLSYTPFTSEVIANALGLSGNLTKVFINELVRFSMLKWVSGESYQVVHRLIHTYARQQKTVQEGIFERLLDYYMKMAKEQGELGIEGYNKLDDERPHLMTILTEGVQRERWKEALNLIRAIDEYLDRQGHWTERVIATEFGVRSARTLKNSQEEAYWLSHLGNTYRKLGQNETAIDYLKQALAIAREIGDRQSEVQILSKLGNAYYSLSQMEIAIDYQKLALAIAREIGSRQSESVALGDLGVVYRDLGQLETAIDHHKQALAISREIGDRQGEGADLGNLGIVYYTLGQNETAIDYLKQALAIARKVGDREDECNVLGNLGNVYENLRQLETAIDYHKQALAISREIGDRQSEGTDLNNLGSAHMKLEQFEIAIDYCQQALDIAHKVGDRAGEASRLGNLGIAYRYLGQVETAVEFLKQALAIFEEIKSPDAEEARRLLEEYQKI